MNNQERLMVLRMVEEGKINADDAVKLLDALNANSIDNFIGENAEKLKVLFTEIKARAGEFAKKVEPTVIEVKERVEETYKKLEPKLKDVGGKVKKTANDIVDQISKKLNGNECCKGGCSCEEDEDRKDEDRKDEGTDL